MTGPFSNFADETGWPKERFGWYAPGKYWCTCQECGKNYNGDKRSGHCYPCAVAAAEAQVTNNLGSGI